LILQNKISIFIKLIKILNFENKKIQNSFNNTKNKKYIYKISKNNKKFKI